MKVNDWRITLRCRPKPRDHVEVVFLYAHPTAPGGLVAVGRLHLNHHRLFCLVAMLRSGGAALTLVGPYVDAHPELQQAGRETDA